MIDTMLTFTEAQQLISVSISITDDIIFEDAETFTANLVLISSDISTEIRPPQATITIEDDDCELLASLSH